MFFFYFLVNLTVKKNILDPINIKLNRIDKSEFVFIHENFELINT